MERHVKGRTVHFLMSAGWPEVAPEDSTAAAQKLKAQLETQRQETNHMAVSMFNAREHDFITVKSGMQQLLLMLCDDDLAAAQAIQAELQRMCDGYRQQPAGSKYEEQQRRRQDELANWFNKLATNIIALKTRRPPAFSAAPPAIPGGLPTGNFPAIPGDLPTGNPPAFPAPPPAFASARQPHFMPGSRGSVDVAPAPQPRGTPKFPPQSLDRSAVYASKSLDAVSPGSCLSASSAGLESRDPVSPHGLLAASLELNGARPAQPGRTTGATGGSRGPPLAEGPASRRPHGPPVPMSVASETEPPRARAPPPGIAIPTAATHGATGSSAPAGPGPEHAPGPGSPLKPLQQPAPYLPCSPTTAPSRTALSYPPPSAALDASLNTSCSSTSTSDCLQSLSPDGPAERRSFAVAALHASSSLNDSCASTDYGFPVISPQFTAAVPKSGPQSLPRAQDGGAVPGPAGGGRPDGGPGPGGVPHSVAGTVSRTAPPTKAHAPPQGPAPGVPRSAPLSGSAPQSGPHSAPPSAAMPLEFLSSIAPHVPHTNQLFQSLMMHQGPRCAPVSGGAHVQGLAVLKWGPTPCPSPAPHSSVSDTVGVMRFNQVRHRE